MSNLTMMPALGQVQLQAHAQVHAHEHLHVGLMGLQMLTKLKKGLVQDMLE